MLLTPPHFVAEPGDLAEVLHHAKQHGCPHCRRTGTLIGHGLLFGYAEHGSERVLRGRRLLCSKRHRRPGCGRTWSVRLTSVIAGFSVRTAALSHLLSAVVQGIGRKATWTAQAPGLSTRSGYRLWRRLCAAQSHIRTALCSLCPTPPSKDPRPIAQLLAHLEHALGTAHCVLASFQLTFQRSVLG